MTLRRLWVTGQSLGEKILGMKIGASLKDQRSDFFRKMYPYLKKPE